MKKLLKVVGVFLKLKCLETSHDLMQCLKFVMCIIFNIIGIVLFGLLTSGIIHIFNSEWVYKQIDGIVNKPELYLPIIKIFLLGLCVGSTVLVISIIIISIILISICFVKWIKNNWKQANEIVDNKENFK